jgi:hypothetical protein
MAKFPLALPMIYHISEHWPIHGRRRAMARRIISRRLHGLLSYRQLAQPASNTDAKLTPPRTLFKGVNLNHSH